MLREANKLAADYFRASVVEYVLVSSLSISSFPATQVRIRDRLISPLKQRGARYPYPDVLISQMSGTPVAEHVKSTRYQLIKIKTRGRSVAGAVDTAHDAVNLLRGLWTLLATYGSWSIRFGPSKHLPIGVIHMGPIHTLHHPDGTPVGEFYWYEPDYTGDQKLFQARRGWEPIEKNRKWAVRRLKRLPYRNDIEDLLIRYVRALDHSNLDVGFLEMWSILEKLTKTVGAKYDETIRRATWILQNRNTKKQLLASLRLRRNRLVHAATSGEDRDQAAYMIKSFVEPHLASLIVNEFRVQSLEEYAEYLHLPTDSETLQKRRRQLSRAIRRFKQP